MAIKATIFKADLQVADMDRAYYGGHALTLARHPSETDERMMVRMLAFALHAHEALAFGQGLTNDDEPDLWRKDLTGTIELWIDVGLPEEKVIRRACGRANQVAVYTYGTGADIWWNQNRDKLARNHNLAVTRIPVENTRALSALAERSMRLNCSIQDGHIYFGDGNATVEVTLEKVKEATPEFR